MKLTILFLTNLSASIAIGLSMVIIPWELLSLSDGSSILASIASVSTFILIFLTPIIGGVIDSVNRKTVIIISMAIMGTILLFCSIFYGNITIRIIILSVFYFSSQLFFAVFYNARNAFIQESFEVSEYSKINSLMEIETQLSTIISAIFTIIYLDESMFNQVIFLSSALLMISSFFTTFLKGGSCFHEEKTVSRRFKFGLWFEIFDKNRKIFIVSLCANSPFIAVMMINIANPAYIKNIIEGGISLLAIFTISFSAGASLISAMGSSIIRAIGSYRLIFWSILLFSSTSLVVVLKPTSTVIVIMAFFWGGFNSLSKIALSTYLMKNVKKDEIGSFYGVIQSLVYISRTIIGFFLAWFFVQFGIDNSYIVILCTTLIAIVIFTFSHYASINKNTHILSTRK